MSLLLLTYIINILKPLHTLIFVIATLSSTSSMVYVVWCTSINDGYYYSYQKDKEGNVLSKVLEKEKQYHKYGKMAIITTIISFILSTFVPSEKTGYMMLAAYATESVVTNEKIINKVDKIVTESDNITNKVVTIINQKLDSYISDNEKEKK